MAKRIRPDQLRTLGPKIVKATEKIVKGMTEDLSDRALSKAKSTTPVRFGDLLAGWRKERAPVAPKAKAGKAAVNPEHHGAVIDAGKRRTKHASSKAPRGISEPVGEDLLDEAPGVFEKHRRRAEADL